jgi:NADPH:quinone reductase
MRAMVAERFEDYGALRLSELEQPRLQDGEVLVRMIGAGVTPLDYTILSGHFPFAKAPLVLGNEGSGIVESDGSPEFPPSTKVAFCGPYGVRQNGTYGEMVAVRREHLLRVPDGIDPVSAAGLPVAYLTAYLALRKAGFAQGKSVLAPAIGGSVGNAAIQLARAQGALHAISTSTSTEKARQASEAGFTEVIDLSAESLGDGVKRLTGGNGVDIVIDGIGGEILSQAISSLAPSGIAITLGYAGDKKSRIDVTDLIWKGASLLSFSLFGYPPEEWQSAWRAMEPLFASGKLRPIVARTFRLEDAAEALRFQIEKRPFGRVLLQMN